MNRLLILFCACLFVFPAKLKAQQVNDHIFAAAPEAKPYIDFDKKGFIVKGKRTFLVSAGLEYARIPHELWYDRLMRIKRAGFNCVEVYTIWNFHEPTDGKFNFSGDADLEAFLKMVNDLGMYSIVRVGPYYCAEWDSGGYPIWLKFKPGVRVRQHNLPFEKYVDRFFDHLLPIVLKQQINYGGSVILIQLENEHPKGWGIDMPDEYFKHLQQKSLAMGMQVPYFFSGLHHATDPAIDGAFDADRPNPWLSTEFWSVWYNQYGAKPADADIYDRRTWKIIANGGNGYNYYMVHGGSNFGYTNNDEDAASYDYGAAIGQAGDLRPIYYTFKRAAWFARSFEEVLQNSENKNAIYKDIVKDTALKVTARGGPAGTIVFIDNKGTKPISTRLYLGDKTDTPAYLSVLPGDIYPLIHNYKFTEHVTINWALTRIYAIVKQGSAITIITDAENGATLNIDFKSDAKVSDLSASLKMIDGHIILKDTMRVAERPLIYHFKAGDQTVRIIAMNRQQTDHAFIDDLTPQNTIISGVAYAGGINTGNNSISAEIESPVTSAASKTILAYTEKGTAVFNITPVAAAIHPDTIRLNKWKFKMPVHNTFASPGNWMSSANPLPMGADGDITANAWYKTVIKVATTGKYALQVKGGGRGKAYIDGKPVANWLLNEGEVSINLKKGKHLLTIFAAHDGRDKLAAYLGPIDGVDSKGIFGKALLKKGGSYISELTGWYMAKAAKGDDKKGSPRFNASIFKKYKIGEDAFNLHEGYAWFHTSIPKQATQQLVLLFKSVDENAVVFINGKQVYRHTGWNQPFEIPITDSRILKNTIALDVFIENYSNEGGIDQAVKINTISNAQQLTGWKMKGGPGGFADAAKWPLLQQQPGRQASYPTFYQTNFTVPQFKGYNIIWRFNPNRLGHGSVWVNGHNLGRYPEKTAAPGMYIPECWLKAGNNELVIYDEDGKSPLQTTIAAEEQVSAVQTTIIADIKSP
jgi:beta-galactosidase